jgi:hypothetical protein
MKYPRPPTFVRQQTVAYQQHANHGVDNANSTRVRDVGGKCTRALHNYANISE